MAAKKRIAGTALVVAVLFTAGGCVRIHQLIKMHHDGSGTLIEKVRVMPRVLRLLAGRKKRTGKAENTIQLVSEQFLQQRLKAYGEVTLKSKKLTTLPDGSKQLEAVYAFKNINKVKLWMIPTFACTDKNRTGQLGFDYKRIVYHNWDKKYYKADNLSLKYPRHPGQKKFSAPAVVQRYRNVTPVFLDMLKDFRFEIQIQAPDDVEEFDDVGMVGGMPISDNNKVTVLRVYGENIIQNPEMIRGFIMGEIGGRTDAWGGNWRPMERALPDTMTPYGCDYYGMHVRFLKMVAVPRPKAKPKKKKK